MNQKRIGRLQIVWVILGIAATYLTTSLYNFHTEWGWTYESKPPLWHVILDFAALGLFGLLVASVTTRAVSRRGARVPTGQLDPGIILGYSIALLMLISGFAAFTLLSERAFETLGRALIAFDIAVVIVGGISYLRFSRRMKTDPEYKLRWATVLGDSDR